MIRYARKRNRSTRLTSHEVQTLNRFSTEVPISAGKVLTTQGQFGTQAFLIIDGHAQVTRDGEPVARVGAGELIGEAALLGTGSRNATIVATTDMTVRVMHQTELASLMAECPRLGNHYRLVCIRRLANGSVPARPALNRSVHAGLKRGGVWAVAALLAVGSVFAVPASASAHHNRPAAVGQTTVTVGIASTPIGDVLTDSQGRTLYAFLHDISDQGATDSVCDAICSRTRPPLAGSARITSNHPQPMRIFSFERADGTRQAVVGQWPAYTFVGDAKPGDVSGHIPNGAWRAISASGGLLR